jgi:lysophospholipase L1-like esterase
VNYRRNLENMITVAEQGGAKVLITTQAMMLWDMLPPRECAEVQVASFRRLQDIQREVARERGVALAETGSLVESEEERHFKESGKHLFKNDVHPLDEGSDLIARTIAEAIVQKGLLPK